MDGKSKWEVGLPSKRNIVDSHHVGVDNNGNPVVVLNTLSEDSSIPDSYKERLPSQAQGDLSMQGVKSMVTTFSPDGKILWQHKNTKDLSTRGKPLCGNDGRVVTQNKWDTNERFVDVVSGDVERLQGMKQEMMKSAVDETAKEKQQEKPSGDAIKINEAAGTVNIDGVQLNING
jgi:hypothetical protein